MIKIHTQIICKSEELTKLFKMPCAISVLFDHKPTNEELYKMSQTINVDLKDCKIEEF